MVKRLVALLFTVHNQQTQIVVITVVKCKMEILVLIDLGLSLMFVMNHCFD